MRLSYAEHIQQLATAFKVAMIQNPNMPSDDARAVLVESMGLSVPVIIIAPVQDERTYAIGLHELGHLLAPCGMLSYTEGSQTYRLSKGVQFGCIRDVKLIIESELAAWEWAHSFALTWTPAMTNVEVIALSSYHELAKRYGVPFPRQEVR